MEPRNGTHEDQPRHRPQRRARRPGPRPGTRYRTRRRQPGSGRSAALAANPGSAVAVIADAAGTGKPAARAALLAMEKAGTATRVKGAKPGIPDTWTLAEPAPDAAGPAADPQAGQAGQPGEDPAGSPDGATEDETAGGTGQDRTAETGDPAPEDGDDAEAGRRAVRRRRSPSRTTPLPKTITRTPSRTSRTTRPRRAATRTTATPRTTRTPRRTPAARPATSRTRPSSRT